MKMLGVKTLFWKKER